MMHLPFREHPEKSPSGKVSVFGPSLCPAEKMQRYAQRRNPEAPRAAEIYVELGSKYGIRGDVAFCQAMLDTKVWREAPAGAPSLAARIWGYEPSAWREPELEAFAERHFQHLFEAAKGKEKIPFYWEDLNNRWTLPGNRYGQDILAIWRSMMNWRCSHHIKKQPG